MRVAITDSASGGGKTTLARRLAGVLGVPPVELDALVIWIDLPVAATIARSARATSSAAAP